MGVWSYGLLGPVEVRVDDRAVELSSASQRLLLAMLLLAANQVVPAGRLMDELWGEALSRDPPAALRTQVSRLRRALGPAAGSLVTVGGGYRLSMQRGQLDAARFEVDWSYRLLTTAEQRLFDQLSVFRGWFDIAAARAITAPHDDGTGVARLVLRCAATGSNDSNSAASWMPPATGTPAGPRNWSRRRPAACTAPARPAGRHDSMPTSVTCAPPTAG